MPLPADPLYGKLYMQPADFIAQAKVYGADKAVNALGAGAAAAVTATIAIASRTIEEYCQQHAFDPEEIISETHKFDYRKPRVTPSYRPLSVLVSFVVRLAPSSTTQIPITPVTNDAQGNPVSWGTVYYNRQEHYLELSTLQYEGGQIFLLGTTSFLPAIVLGLTEPQVEIAYKVGAGLKPQVAAATGYQTSFLLNLAFGQNQQAANIRSMSTPELSLSFVDQVSELLARSRAGVAAGLHPMVSTLLPSTRRIIIA